jgi:opacity protein-like surface antigen
MSPRWLILSVAVGVCQTALADQTGNWALSLGLGANYGARTEVEGPDVKVEYDLGLPRLSGSVSRRLGERWWLDLSLAQRKTKMEFYFPSNGGPSSDVGANDRFTSASLMLSAIREFEIGPLLKPYIGFGAGPAWLTYELSQSPPGGEPDQPLIKDDATALAILGTVGFRFPLTRRLDLGVAYEYWRTPDVTLDDVNGEDVKLDQTVHSGWVSVSYYPGADRETAFGMPRVNGPEDGGFYLLGNLGVNWLRDAESSSVTFDGSAPGVLAAVALGHDVGRRWRLEAEYAYRTNTPQVLDFGRAIGETRVDGKLSSSSLGLNLHLDLLPDAAIQPTAGVGVGVSRLDYDVRFQNDEPFTDDSMNAAYFSVFAGFNIELSRSLSFRTTWRMWKTAKHDVSLADGGELTTIQEASSVDFGLLYRLGG